MTPLFWASAYLAGKRQRDPSAADLAAELPLGPITLLSKTQKRESLTQCTFSGAALKSIKGFVPFSIINVSKLSSLHSLFNFSLLVMSLLSAHYILREN